MISAKNILKQLQLKLTWWKIWRTKPVEEWLEAAELYRCGDYRLAADYYRNGLEKHPSNRAAEAARLDLSYCYYQLYQYQDAERELLNLVKLNSRFMEARILLSKTQNVLGQITSAYKTTEQGIKFFPISLKMACLHLENAIYAESTNEEAETARKHLSNLLIASNSDNIYRDLAETILAYYELKYGNPQNTDKIISQLITNDKVPYQLYYVRAERLLEQGHIFQARQQLRKALSHDKRNPRGTMLLANTFLVLGSFDEIDSGLQLAKVACEKSNWENPDCLKLLSKAYELNGEPHYAELFSKQSLKISATSSLKLSNLDQLVDQVKALRNL